MSRFDALHYDVARGAEEQRRTNRLLEDQRDIDEESLNEARRQTEILQEQVEVTRRQTQELERQSRVAEEHLRLAYLTAEREEQARRFTWQETTENGRRYAALARDAARLLTWLKSTDDAVVDDYIAEMERSGLMAEARDPQQQQRIANEPLPASPQTRPAAGDKARNIFRRTVLLLPIAIVLLVGYVIGFSTMLDAGIDAGSEFWVGLNERGYEDPAMIALVLGVPTIIIVGLTVLAAAAMDAAKHRKEAHHTLAEHTRWVAEAERRRADANNWLDLHERRKDRWGFDPLLEDVAANENWLTAMKGTVATPREVANILRSIVEVDYQWVTVDLLEHWETFLASISYHRRDGAPPVLLLTETPEAPSDDL